ncbi:SDR family NAD(P)-dependent oxidoreductase [Xanthomonas campestris]|uniref:SDR family NAD(P)-dependent oxidoreductase n=1 Tax=Xanthomonas TaxID=338 RepID=UPI001E2E00C2|nr:SDR family oxidoreductase [Xanthomonas campestris]MCC5090453.1 SDR family oxidoreductase [Xanthomonas campestris]
MTDLLAGKVVVVTGAASGIGRAIAVAAARHGAKAVVVSDVSEAPREGGESTTSVLMELGIRSRFVTADVSKRDQVDQLVDAAEEFGGVDVMVCNAGITLRADGVDVAEDAYRHLMSVNLDGVLFCAQAAARQMQSHSKQGSIVMMASMGGIKGAGMTVAYSTSKGGVVLMAKAMADALGPTGIRVNAICPGTIDTALLRNTPGVAEASEGFRKRTPLRRLGKPSEIGDAVVWLGSDMSSYVTGIALYVDGGLLSVL